MCEKKLRENARKMGHRHHLRKRGHLSALFWLWVSIATVLAAVTDPAIQEVQVKNINGKNLQKISKNMFNSFSHFCNSKTTIDTEKNILFWFGQLIES